MVEMQRSRATVIELSTKCRCDNNNSAGLNSQARSSPKQQAASQSKQSDENNGLRAVVSMQRSAAEKMGVVRRKQKVTSRK